MTRWPTTTDLNSTPTVQVLLTGLMAYCYNSGKGCEIGAFGGDNHALTMEVSRNGEIEEVPLPAAARKIALVIKDVAPAPDFLHKPGFNRYHGHPLDFRWLVDLEGNDDGGYGMTLLKKQNYFQRKIFISHGTFYTFRMTRSTFVSPEGPIQRLGHFAWVTGCHINLTNRLMVLQIDDTDVYTFDPEKGTYRVVFWNHCFENGKACRRTDFEDVFDLFVDQSKRYTIDLDDDNSAGTPEDPIPPLPHARHPLMTDSAPCMGAGFGGTGGF